MSEHMALNEEQKAAVIPYYVHEGEMNRLERLNKRWFISFLIVLVMLFIYESQYRDEVYTYEVQQDSGEGGTNTYTGNSVKITGGDYNGEADNPGGDSPQGEDNATTE